MVVKMVIKANFMLGIFMIIINLMIIIDLSIKQAKKLPLVKSKLICKKFPSMMIK
jgi:hypothetical protein